MGRIAPPPAKSPLAVLNDKPLYLESPWVKWFSGLLPWIERQRPPLLIDADRNVTAADLLFRLVCSGTITLTLPVNSLPGDSYYVFNNDVGVITIAGTVNGNPAGYSLVNPYQYAELTSLDGTVWILTLGN